MHSFDTDTYRLHVYQPFSGYRFVMAANHEAGDLRDLLKTIYSVIFVEKVVKNPLYRPGTPIRCRPFMVKLQEAVSKELTTPRR